MGQQKRKNGGSVIRRGFARAAVTTLFALSPGLAAAGAPPPCALTLSGTGQPVDFKNFRGQVLYVDFWASWCAPCLASFPFMNELQRDYGGRGLHVLAIGMDETPADARRFLDQHPARFDVTNGPNGQCAKDFGVGTMPTSFLVDRSGAIRAVHKGFRPADRDELRKQLETLIAETAAGQ